ncbi:hypothetical protein CHELA1G11_14333 [Hyphomicrobiales bacterium]|nr:hypothetical protein CHELA1G11_14333 [Hyphomicrobiales bacterium]CAH1680849.1 hypothetical protein CHELA1G2_14772 [Hyphomicrobiales bacterium]
MSRSNNIEAQNTTYTVTLPFAAGRLGAFFWTASPNRRIFVVSAVLERLAPLGARTIVPRHPMQAA